MHDGGHDHVVSERYLSLLQEISDAGLVLDCSLQSCCEPLAEKKVCRFGMDIILHRIPDELGW